ncbi:hypothetical protein AMTR_s00062p00190850 [Amborella trichopoda]|uniref:Aminotransferase-like plant mobile domain-containing protein n=1 Tax=Amborella trichopoda TaxID=13333 RepID=U5DGY7_AMBTC|nr:hypothetical protein AMTR_s00062p00190850 [Amborella trichopoda]
MAQRAIVTRVGLLPLWIKASLGGWFDKLVTIKFSWLKERFMILLPNASNDVVERHMMAYLVYLVGSTIFTGSTSNEVLTRYLKLFEDIDRAERYAWGAAVLAFLFRSLHKFVNTKTQHFSGSTTLFSLMIIREWLQWVSHKRSDGDIIEYKSLSQNVAYYRQEIDLFDFNKVQWQSYIMEPNTSQMDQDEWKASTNAFTSAMSNSFLIVDNIAKRYMPEQVLRQFGFKQGIPLNPERWISKVQRTLQHLSSVLDPDDMGPIAREHVIAACRQLSIKEVHTVEEADEDKDVEDEEAEEGVPLLGLDKAVEVEPFLERQFNL